MKTLLISDELHDKLMRLATDYIEQDNRGTHKPYLFQIRTRKKVYDHGFNNDVLFFYSSDRCEYETLKELQEDYNDIPDDVHSLVDIHMFHEDWLEEKELTACSYSYEYELQNGFLTEKACKEHIERNHYHYDEPVDYLTHAWRNSDMDTINELLLEIGNSKE